MAAAIGSSMMSTSRAPASFAASFTARSSTLVISAGTQIVTCGFGLMMDDHHERSFITFLMKYESIASVTSKSAMTPSRSGRIAWMCAGVRPSIWRASSPTASTRPVFMSLATTEGSRSTMPLPLTCTSTLAVPRSIPMSKCYS